VKGGRLRIANNLSLRLIGLCFDYMIGAIQSQRDLLLISKTIHTETELALSRRALIARSFLFAKA
jgi:hypothetical protein